MYQEKDDEDGAARLEGMRNDKEEGYGCGEGGHIGSAVGMKDLEDRKKWKHDPQTRTAQRREDNRASRKVEEPPPWTTIRPYTKNHAQHTYCMYLLSACQQSSHHTAKINQCLSCAVFLPAQLPASPVT